jgi:polyhydroxyalkanoate synthesis regulator phasin
MRKNILSKKLVMLISVLSITGLLLTGCSSSNKNTQANAATQDQQGQQSEQNGKNFGANLEERKKQMEDSVNSLVSDGTITKDQGTKVLAALTSSTQRPNGQKNNNNGNGQGNANSNNQNNNQQGQKGQQAPNNQNGQSKGFRGNFNPLSQLVSDGTITQEQADKIMEKVRTAMPQRQNNNNGATNNNNSNNSNSNSNNNSTGS